MFDEDAGDRSLARNVNLSRAVAPHYMRTSNPLAGDGTLFKEEAGAFGPILRAVYPLSDDMAKLREIERGTSVGFSFGEIKVNCGGSSH